MDQNNEEVYYGKGNAGMFDEYVDFINYVFGFNGNQRDFKKLLPKLYKPEYDPAGNSYVAVENGRLKSAIGAYEHDIEVMGEFVKTRGIGNVAVHPYARSKGYMRKLLNMAIDDMVKDGVALSVLGGKRQRYNYFSYDKVGSAVEMVFNGDNMRHVFGADRKNRIEIRKIGENDAEILEKIASLYDSQKLHAIRPADKLYDILVSWRDGVSAAFDGGEFIGYAIGSGDMIGEILVEDGKTDLLPDFVCAYFDAFRPDKLIVRLPLHLKDAIKKLIRVCESYAVTSPMSFSVLNYETVLRAFLKLKASYQNLPDGELTVLIDGRGGRENLTISVINGEISVEKSEKAPDLALSHLDAMHLFFAVEAPERCDLPAFARDWLPLPLFLYRADEV